MLIADGSEAKIHRDIFDVGGRYEEGFSVGCLNRRVRSSSNQ